MTKITSEGHAVHQRPGHASKRTRIFLISVFCVLLLVFIFGLMCVIWQFFSLKTHGVAGVFGLSTFNATSSADGDVKAGDSVMVRLRDGKDVASGDLIAYSAADEARAGNVNIARVLYVDESNAQIRIIVQGAASVNPAETVGVVVESTEVQRALLWFISSVWALFVLVLLPGVGMLAMLAVVWRKSYLQLIQSEEKQKPGKADPTEVLGYYKSKYGEKSPDTEVKFKTDVPKEPEITEDEQRLFNAQKQKSKKLKLKVKK